MKREQKFFDMYSPVIGVLAIFTVAILVLATSESGLTQEVYTADSDEHQSSVEDRIRPFGQIYLPGEELTAGEPQVVEATQPEPVATTMSGPQVYNSACIACHGTGIGGAPTIGDRAAWQPRIAQGNDTLYLNALKGYTGSTGFMPEKGGRLDLSDDEIRDAVDYMVAAL
jgi:cytochrome c5